APSPATASSSPAPPYDERGRSRRLRRAGGWSGAEVLEEVLVLVQVQADVVQFVGGTAQGEPYLRWQGASFRLALGEVAAGDDEVSDAAEDSVVRVEDAGDDLRCLGRGKLREVVGELAELAGDLVGQSHRVGGGVGHAPPGVWTVSGGGAARRVALRWGRLAAGRRTVGRRGRRRP